jgi:hypothetical protein
MNIKEELTCKYCNEIYVNPIILNCCGENICQRHIDELISNSSSNKFICPFDNQENANENLSVNKLIQRLVEKELHKLEIDTEYKFVFHKLKREIENLEKILNAPENYIYDEISELKRLVDLDRETLKVKIDEQADGLIKQLESYEKRFNTECKTKLDFKHYSALVESSKKKLNEYENCLNYFSTKKEERNEKSRQSQNEIVKLESKIKELKQNIFSNLSITYKPMDNKSYLFGRLIKKVCLNLIKVYLKAFFIFYLNFRTQMHSWERFKRSLTPTMVPYIR